MTCPRCERDLDEVERDGSRFGHCPQCGGVWFDFEDLDRLSTSTSGAGLDRPTGSGRFPREGDSTLRCPRCEGGLVSVSQDEYPYSSCIVCYGRWVDGGDLPVGTGLSQRIRTLFRKFVEGAS